MSSGSCALSFSAPTIMRQSCESGLSVRDFEVEKSLGNGFLSSVSLVTHKQSKLRCALKAYDRKRLGDQEARQVLREVENHLKLQHPNIIQLYASFYDAEHFYLVLEFASRGDLFQELYRRSGRFTEAACVQRVLAPFIRALGYLHAQGIVHRDVKPENLLFDEYGVLKVCDLGLSINLAQERPMTRVGTLDYMAPEVILRPDQDEDDYHEGGYTAACDSWAVGVLAYECLVGRAPFDRGNKEKTVEAILRAQLEFPAWLSDEACEFIEAALTPDPRRRPSVEDLYRHKWVQRQLASRRASATSTPGASPVSNPQGITSAAAALAAHATGGASRSPLGLSSTPPGAGFVGTVGMGGTSAFSGLSSGGGGGGGASNVSSGRGTPRMGMTPSGSASHLGSIGTGPGSAGPTITLFPASGSPKVYSIARPPASVASHFADVVGFTPGMAGTSGGSTTSSSHSQSAANLIQSTSGSSVPLLGAAPTSLASVGPASPARPGAVPLGASGPVRSPERRAQSIEVPRGAAAANGSAAAAAAAAGLIGTGTGGSPSPSPGPSPPVHLASASLPVGTQQQLSPGPGPSRLATLARNLRAPFSQQALNISQDPTAAGIGIRGSANGLPLASAASAGTPLDSATSLESASGSSGKASAASGMAPSPHLQQNLGPLSPNKQLAYGGRPGYGLNATSVPLPGAGSAAHSGPASKNNTPLSSFSAAASRPPDLTLTPSGTGGGGGGGLRLAGPGVAGGNGGMRSVLSPPTSGGFVPGGAGGAALSHASLASLSQSPGQRAATWIPHSGGMGDMRGSTDGQRTSSTAIVRPRGALESTSTSGTAPGPPLIYSAGTSPAAAINIPMDKARAGNGGNSRPAAKVSASGGGAGRSDVSDSGASRLGSFNGGFVAGSPMAPQDRPGSLVRFFRRLLK